jgi:putative ABC transport system ATP-binding protein
VVALFRDLADRRGAAIVMVTHDNKVLDIADRIIHLEAGTLAAAPTPDPALGGHQVDGHERA